MNHSRLILSLLLATALVEAKAQLVVEVTNPSDVYREEVIEPATEHHL